MHVCMCPATTLYCITLYYTVVAGHTHTWQVQAAAVQVHAETDMCDSGLHLWRLHAELSSFMHGRLHTMLHTLCAAGWGSSCMQTSMHCCAQTPSRHRRRPLMPRSLLNINLCISSLPL